MQEKPKPSPATPTAPGPQPLPDAALDAVHGGAAVFTSGAPPGLELGGLTFQEGAFFTLTGESKP